MSTIICPNCGAQVLRPPLNSDELVCANCGAKININVNYNFNYSKSEHTKHIVDDAKIQSAENRNRVIGIFATPFEEYRVRKEHKRHMEEEAQRAQEEAVREAQAQARENAARRAEWRAENFPKIAHYITTHKQETLLTIIVAILLVFSVVTFYQKSADRAARRAADSIAARVAAGEAQMPASSFTGDYRTAVRDLKEAGFTNVTAEGAGDLYFGFLNKENDIIEVTVDGAPDFTQGTWYAGDVPIVISYHSFPERSASSATSASSVTQSISEESATESSAAVQQEEVASSSTALVMPSDADWWEQLAKDAAFGIEFDDYTVCYWISPSNRTVRHFCYGNGDTYGLVGHITDGTYDTGYTVHFNYDSGWDEQLVISDGVLTVTDADGAETTMTDEFDMDSVREVYKNHFTDMPES